MDSESYKSNLWKFYLIESLRSFWFILPIFLIYFRSFQISYSQFALLEIAGTIVVILFEIPTGVFADFIGKKWSVLLSYLFFSLAMAVIGFGSVFMIFLLGYLLWGIADAFYSGASTSLLYDTVKKIKREKDFLKFRGRSAMLSSIALIIGSISAGYLYEIDKRLPWFIYACFLFVAAVVVVFFKEPFRSRKKFSIENQLSHTKDSIRFLISHKELRMLTIFIIIISMSTTIFVNQMEQPYLLSIGFSIVSLGFIFAVTRGTLGLLSTYIYKVEKRLGEKISFYLVTLAYSSIFILLGLIKLPLMVVFVTILFFSRDYKEALIDKYVNKHVKPQQRATVLSVQSLLLNISSTFFYFIGGLMLDRLSLNTVLTVLGIVTFVTLIPFLIIKYRNNK